MPALQRLRRDPPADMPSRQTMHLEGIITEGWAEGFQVGALVILMLFTICNLRRNVLLHKLILFEQFCALWIACTLFFPDPLYGRWFSGCMLPLYTSYTLHNVIAWLKIRPFLKRRGSVIFLVTLVCVQPYWVYALYQVIVNWNGLPGNHYEVIRPWESVMREPWWVFTTIYVILTIKRTYHTSLMELFHISARFAVLILCMFLSLVFIFTDMVTTAGSLLPQSGQNPFWHLALVFKCASDVIFLDDFKKVLNDLVNSSLNKARGGSTYGQQGGSASRPLPPNSNPNMLQSWSREREREAVKPVRGFERHISAPTALQLKPWAEGKRDVSIHATPIAEVSKPFRSTSKSQRTDSRLPDDRIEREVNITVSTDLVQNRYSSDDGSSKKSDVSTEPIRKS